PVGSNVAIILRITRTDTADRADAHAVEVGTRFSRVALKIPVQRAVPLRYGQLVTRPGEVIHADVVVSGMKEVFEACPEDAEFLHALGKLGGESALLLAQPRDMRIAEHRHAIRRQRYHLLDRGPKALGG